MTFASQTDSSSLISSSAGEAEVGSAGEQPAKEEAARDSVFEENHICRVQIGNRPRSAPNLKRNDHEVCLGAKRRLDGLFRGLLCKGQTNEKHGCGNCATGLNEPIGETWQPRRK